ncbi:MAG: hypothetical protein WCI92_01900 [Bacteroidota bacterium]
MKRLFLVTAIILLGLGSKAQEFFSFSKEGTVLLYKTFDKKEIYDKGKLQTYTELVEIK